MAETDDLTGYTLVTADPSLDSDEEIARGLRFVNLLQAEVLPDDPPNLLEEAIAAHRAVPARVRRVSFRVIGPDGERVGGAGASFDPDHDDNPDVIGLNVNVHLAHRRKGIATRLIASMVDLARAEGRTRFLCSTNDRWPSGPALCASLGAEVKQRMHLNHLPIASVDRAQLEGWVADAATRSADYELLLWEGRVPDEHVEPFRDLLLVMNTAPRDDLEVNDFTVTVEQIRETEDQMAAAGYQTLQLVARRRADGAFAGLHDVFRSRSDPGTAQVGNTGVVPAHRGAALGKWLKAAGTLHLLEHWPEVTSIRTGNADSNDAMLGINREMGYVPFIAVSTWELSVDAAAAWVAARS